MLAALLAVVTGGLAGSVGYLVDRHRPRFIWAWTGLFGLFFGAVVGLSVFIVPEASVGVMYNPLAGGIQMYETLSQGRNWVSPFAKRQSFSIQTQEYTMSISPEEGAIMGDDSIYCQTNEGLGAWLDLTIRWKVHPKKAPVVWANLGADYPHTFLRPVAHGAIRMVIAKYSVMDIYSKKREKAQKDLLEYMKPICEKYGLILESVLIRNVDPYRDNDDFRVAIDEMNQAEQNITTERRNLEKARYEKDTTINKARGESALILQKARALTENPNYLDYQMATRLGPNVTNIYAPLNFGQNPAGKGESR
jgi:regulator of protease activity HflC (stomatin/prohibitin superfamily)